MKWTPQRLNQLGHVSRGRSRHRPRDAAHLYGGIYPFIQTGDVKHAGLYITEYKSTYSQAGLDQSKLWPSGTLCITIAANIAETAILGFDACFPDSIIGFIADPNKADTRFVKYLFDASLKSRYKQFTQGAAQDNLSQEKLLSLEFIVPCLDAQKEIANIISSYDELIENNTRQIQLLEESARQLYKEWFIRMRFPGHEQIKVVDGVPEGWVKKIFDAVCASIGGGTPSTVNRDYWDGDIEWVTPSDITGSKSIYLDVTEKKITESGLRNSSAKMLPESAILMTSRASVGFFAIANRPVCTNQGFISIVPNDDFSREYLLFNLMSRVDELRARASGTTFKEISRGKFRELSVLWPHESLQTEFGDWVRPILGQIQSLSLMNKKLRQARDLLLPRLMSGEIRV